MQAVAPNKTLTVDRIFGEPSLSGHLSSDIEWSADGHQIAYLETSGSGMDRRRSIWVMDTSTGARRVLLPADKLKPPPEADNAKHHARLTYRWSAGGDRLLVTVGTSLILFDIKSSSLKHLIAGPDTIAGAQFSPDGRWVSFVRRHNLWLANLADGSVTPLTTGGNEQLHMGEPDWLYSHEFGLKTAYWWAPDSSTVAYLEIDDRAVSNYPIPEFLKRPARVLWQQYPEAGGANPIVRVFVAKIADRKSRLMDTGGSGDVYVPRVRFTPDSKQIAIERMNRAQTKLDLLITNAVTGRSRTIVTESDAYWINVNDGPYFFRDGRRFLWSSERSGYRHLYLYNLEGREIRQLTQGRWQVCRLEAVDETGQSIYFTATEKSPLERHFYRIGLDGSGLKRITRADGWHRVTVSPRGQAFVDTYSNAMTPPRQDLLRADGSMVAAVNENATAELSSYGRSPVEFLTIVTHDDAVLNAMMIKPVGFDPHRKYPVIVFMNGGPRQQGVRKAWEGWISLWHEMMAEKGFLIFAVDNRGSGGHGHLFEEPLHFRFGAQEISDQRDGVAYLRGLPYVDASRIGVWGINYGGQLALHAMFEDPQDFKAGFAQSPISNWLLYRSAYAERYLGSPKTNLEEYQESSPVTTAVQLQGKLLVAASTGDQDVHFANTLELRRVLTDAGKYAEIVTFPGQPEGITDPAARTLLFRRVTDFFVDNLK
jgi:dipeptidyl-peptidase-4